MFIRCMKNVGAIRMYIDIAALFRINIAADMIPLIDYQTPFSRLISLMRKHSTV